MIDPKFFQVVAQLSHFGWGTLVVTWLGLLVHGTTFWLIWAVLEIAAAVKEFWYDENYENPVTRGSNLLDFSMYTAGALIAYLALLIAGLR